MNRTITFLVPSSSVRSTHKGDIKSLTAGKERLDVLSRCFLNLSRWSKRLNVTLVLIFYLSHKEENLAIRIEMSNLQRELKSELDALVSLVEFFNETKQNAFETKEITFEALVQDIADDAKLFYLTSDGKSLEKYNKEFEKENVCFIIGSQEDLQEEQEKIVSDFGAISLSLGKKEYLASHVITIICNNLMKSQ